MFYVQNKSIGTSRSVAPFIKNKIEWETYYVNENISKHLITKQVKNCTNIT